MIYSLGFSLQIKFLEGLVMKISNTVYSFLQVQIT